MKNNEKNIIFYDAWWQMLAGKSDEFRHSVLDAVMAYAFDGKDADFPKESGQQIAYETICNYINQNRDKYAEKIAKAEERWKKKKNSHADAGSADAGSVDKDKDKDNEKEKENEKDKVKDKDKVSKETDILSLSQKDNNISSVDEAEREKIIFDYALFLLSEGRKNAYSEAAKAYDYNAALGWVREKTLKDGSTVRQPVIYKLAWLKSRDQKPAQIFAPQHGTLLAGILRKTGCKVENADIFNLFRGCAVEGDTVHLFFARITGSVARFGKALSEHPRTKEIVGAEIRKMFPETTAVAVSARAGR